MHTSLCTLASVCAQVRAAAAATVLLSIRSCPPRTVQVSLLEACSDLDKVCEGVMRALLCTYLGKVCKGVLRALLCADLYKVCKGYCMV